MQLEMTASDLCEPAITHYWMSDDDDVPTPPMAILDLLGHLRERGLGEDALALARALGTFEFGDPRTAQLAAKVEHRLAFLGARPSPAARLVGQARALAAWVHADCWGDQLQLAIGFEYPGEEARGHTLSVLVDSNYATIKDAWLAPPLDEYLGHLRESLAQAPERHSQVMQLREVSLDEAAAILVEATEWSEQDAWEQLEDREARGLIALMDARCSRMLDEVLDGGRELPEPDWHQRPSELDELDEGGLVERLVDSDEFAAEREHGANEVGARIVGSFVETWIDGGNARFGPHACEMLLLHHAPAAAAVEERDELRTALLPAARAWARLVHRVLELPAAACDAVLEELECSAEHLDDALDGVPPGGGGFADRLVAEMERDGVDVSDPKQVAAFMEAFNDRTFEERGRVLGME